MAKKKSSGCLPFLIVVVVAIFFLLSNLFNFKILASHGFGQYLANVGHFHRDKYCQVKSSFDVYDKVMPVAELSESKVQTTIKTNGRFKFKGYREKENVTWIGVKIFENNKVIYGYILNPKKISISSFWSSISSIIGDDNNKINNPYFSEISYKDTEQFRKYMHNIFEKQLYQRVKVQKVTGATKIQSIRESKDFEIIPYLKSSDTIAYYCSKAKYPVVESIYNAYLGDNFETQYLQTNKAYKAMEDGVFQESLFMRSIDKLYFKIGFPILLIILLKIVRSFLAREKCVSCNSGDITEQSRDLIGQKYKHEKKDEERDQRYKDNPLINTWRLNMKCSNCGHEWTKEVLKETTGDKSTSPSSKIYADDFKDKQVYAPERGTQSHAGKPGSVVLADKLKMLNTALEKGLISEDEYEQKRKMVIEQM